MDWYPLWNSLRIASAACVIVFFTGIFAAYYAAKLPRALKGLLDVALTLPLVLPPTVCGYFLLLLLGPKRPLGILLSKAGIQFAMTWYGGIAAAAVVAFPLMYRTARGAFESGFCQGAGRIRGYQHADRVCAWQDGDYFNHGLSAVEDR